MLPEPWSLTHVCAPTEPPRLPSVREVGRALDMTVPTDMAEARIEAVRCMLWD